MACRDGSLTAEMLASRTMLIETKDVHGFTPLYTAAIFGHLTIVELLLAAGASVEVTDLGGLGSLHIAAEKGHVDVALCIVRHSPQTANARDSIGRTPIDWARAKGHDALVQALSPFSSSNACPGGRPASHVTE
jgi:ankyrin repeat protein